MHAAQMPSAVRSAGASGARLLDVRPVLAKGGDPFRLILKTVGELAPKEALHLVVGFEPKPLYLVLRAKGLSHHAEQSGGLWHVWFFRANAAAGEASPATDDASAPLQTPVTLDVRGLEPPQPMITILEKLAELGPGAQLEVHHHREPVLLYEKLQLRGYAARTEKRGEGDYLVRIAPAWAFA
jgi:uncharacterized protein (DUF2249 family)